jgi:hypothetical protein
VVLHPAVARSSTTNGTTVNHGAATSNGFQANLHVYAAGGVWAFTIEHSTTGAFAGEQATLHTFTANGSAIASEHGSGTGAVRQYVRAVLTRTSGNASAVITFARL